MFDIARKVVLLTGGASGIGFEYAKKLLQHGIKALTLVDINAKRGEQVTSQLSKTYTNSEIIFVEADVSNEDMFKAAFDRTIGQFEQLDIVINNAGIWSELNPQRMIDINLKGTTIGTLLAFEKYLPQYRSSDEGVIVNTSSLAGIIPVAFTPVYSATKHGIVTLGRTLGIDPYYQRTKVRIQTLCAGPTDTPMCSAPIDECLYSYQVNVMENFMENYSTQQPNKVAQTLITIITEGQNGSVWLTNEGEGFEVELPKTVICKK